MRLSFITSWTVALALSTSLLGATDLPLKDWKNPAGLHLIAIELPKVPLATIVLTCRAGAMTEDRSTNGLTHLWEHMFFKGNKRLVNQEAFSKRVRQLGILFNGDTSAETVRYFFTLPSANFDAGMQFMADAISTPLLEGKELERERQVVLDEYNRNASHPGFEIGNILRFLMFGDLEYLRNPLGRSSIITSATREQLLKIKDDVFVPANCALVAGGDVTQAAMQESATKHFSAWSTPKNWQPKKHAPYPAFPATNEVIMLKPLAQDASLQITFAGPRILTDPKDTFAADVLATLLEHLQGKFYRKYEDSGLTFGTGFSYHSQNDVGEISIYSQAKPEDVLKVKNMLLAEISLWAKPGYFTKAQLQETKNILRVRHKYELNKPTALTKDLAFWWSVAGLDYYRTYLDNLSDVQEKDITAFVQKYLINKPHLVSILANEKTGKAAGLKDNSEPYSKKFLTNY